jgi:hypothetical protein
MHRRTFFGRLFGPVAAACGATSAAAPPADRYPPYRIDLPSLSPDEEARLRAHWEATCHGVGYARKAVVLPGGIARIPAWEGPPPTEDDD